MKHIDLHKYTEFVKAVTSRESNDSGSFIAHLISTEATNPELNMSLALTAAIGMCGEAGEFSELFKKIAFHKKPYTAEVKEHAAKELGDVIWYWTNACRALGLDPNEVIANNVSKLEARYPGGKFSAEYSENRREGDV